MEEKNKKKQRSIIWMQVIFFIIIIVSVEVYSFIANHNSPSGQTSLSRRIIDGLSADQAKWLVLALLVLSFPIGIYKFYKAFSKNKEQKYPKILEAGLAGKEFSLLSDAEKKKTLHRVKNLIVFGLIFVIIISFLLFKFL